MINAAVQTRVGAAIQAAQEVYPDADIRGCFFHFLQAVWRNVAEKGLAVEYRTNPDLQPRPSNARAVQRLHHRDMGGR